MTTTEIVELAAAIALLAGGIWQYRRRSAENGRRGSQSGVFLILIGLLVGMHALGLFDYRPSQTEIDTQSVPRKPGP